MNNILTELRKLPFNIYLSGYSALDFYYNVNSHYILFITAETSISELATHFSKLDYPGSDIAHASLTENDYTIFFSCVNSIYSIEKHSVSFLNLLYDLKNEKYIDLFGIYRSLGAKKLTIFESCITNHCENMINNYWNVISQLSILISRYDLTISTSIPDSYKDNNIINPKCIKNLLFLVLTSDYPWKGLKYLMKSGFIELYLNELYILNQVDHTKDYHPEGNVWDHTLETLRYNKKNDIALSLSLLLHDVGKPNSTRTNHKAFDKHADIGAAIASKLLKRLYFEEQIIDEIYFLVKYHMMAAAIKRIPLYKTERIMLSPYFKKLLTLYKCDLQSSYRKLDEYLETKNFYKKFIKKNNQKNN